MQGQGKSANHTSTMCESLKQENQLSDKNRQAHRQDGYKLNEDLNEH